MYIFIGATAYPNARYGPGTGLIAFNNLVCTGTELNIFDCDSDGYGVTGTCTHADDASVQCLEGMPPHNYFYHDCSYGIVENL